MKVVSFRKVFNYYNSFKTESSVVRLFLSHKTFLNQFPQTYFSSFNFPNKKDSFSRVLFTGIHSNSLITNFAYEK